MKAKHHGSFVFYTWDVKVRFTHGKDSYVNVAFTSVKDITVFVKITIFK